MKVPGFVGGSSPFPSVVMAGERCVNLFPEILPSGGKAKAMLVSAPGLSDFCTTGDTPGRGLFEDRGRLFAVFGDTLYESDEAGVPTARGAVANDGKPATMQTNGDGGEEIFITAGYTGYIFDLQTNTLTTEVSDVTMSGLLDGFFIALDAPNSTLKISESLDGKTWDPTQIAQRTAAADPWKAMLVSRREIFLFGNKTGEVWYNRGSSPFPFAQRAGAFFEIGIVGDGFSLARFGSTMAWLGESAQGGGVVYQMSGYTPAAISTPSLEWAIQTYKDNGGITNAIGWSYERDGHQFYGLTFPTQGKTWVFDATTRAWHERARWNGMDFVAYRPAFHASAFGKNLVCDAQGNRVFSLSSLVYSDIGGGVLRRVRRTPHLSDENRRLYLSYVELEADRGVGLAVGQGSDPLVMFRTSWDGGMSWGTERTRTLGKLGAYDTRIRWDQCGSGRDLVMEFVVTDPVQARFGDLYVGVS